MKRGSRLGAYEIHSLVGKGGMGEVYRARDTKLGRAGPGTNIHLIAWKEKGEPTPFLVTDYQENSPAFSPDGRYLAYRSNESGRDEVYLQPVPPTGAKWQVSIDGGGEAVWSRDGRELFYRDDDKLMAVKVSTGAVFTPGRPELLFEGRYETTLPSRANYDVSGDGERFLMVKAAGERSKRDRRRPQLGGGMEAPCAGEVNGSHGTKRS